MEKIKSTLTNMIVVLFVVALITGGLLAYVNHVTMNPIAAQNQKKLKDGIVSVMGSKNISVQNTDTMYQDNDGLKDVFVIYDIVKAGNHIGSAVECGTLGFGGELRVLVGFNSENEILGYTILKSAETPGLGAKADKWFQKGGKGNIIGKNPGKDKLIVSKDGGEIDAITASTITSRAFLKTINKAYSAYLKNKTN